MDMNKLIYENISNVLNKQKPKVMAATLAINGIGTYRKGLYHNNAIKNRR